VGFYFSSRKPAALQQQRSSRAAYFLIWSLKIKNAAGPAYLSNALL
jgi:hypothetical protein